MPIPDRFVRYLFPFLVFLLMPGAGGCLGLVLGDLESPSVRGPESTASAQPPPIGPAQPAGEPAKPFAGIVDAHNAVRSQVGVPPLVWSPELARYAQTWADRLAGLGCRMEHRSDGPYGENLAWAAGMDLGPEQVVTMWAREKKNYNHASNACVPGLVCGHYTQVVWRETRRVGCGMARCGNQVIWVCNYGPPGNFVGQKPY